MIGTRVPAVGQVWLHVSLHTMCVVEGAST